MRKLNGEEEVIVEAVPLRWPVPKWISCRALSSAGTPSGQAIATDPEDLYQHFQGGAGVLLNDFDQLLQD